jgi:hypothetical protein
MMSSALGRSVTRPMAAAVGDGDATAYFNAWIAAGDRLVAAAGEALIVLRFSASELCLRASSSLPRPIIRLASRSMPGWYRRFEANRRVRQRTNVAPRARQDR